MQTPSTPSPSPTWCVLRSEIPALEFASFDLKIEVILCYRAHLPRPRPWRGQSHTLQYELMGWRGWDRAEPGLSKEAPGPEGHPGGAGKEWSTPCPLLASQECGPAKLGPRKEGRRQAVPRPLSCPDSYTSAQNQALLDSKDRPAFKVEAFKDHQICHV